jgi:hypothetical protein
MGAGLFWEVNTIQLVEKFPSFYAVRRFITVLTIAHYWISS